MEKYKLPELSFSFDALEPYIDAKTMKVHHDGHHRGYVKKLNSILGEYPDLEKPVEELLYSLDTLPVDIREGVKNNAGGHANHSLFWTLLSPKTKQTPSEEVGNKIQMSFGSLSGFQEKFTETAVSYFSNGWAWLCADSVGELKILTTKDHESPLSKGMTPLLVLDLWEHAYYLKHQNRRPDYVDNFWNVVNWEEVAARWSDFKNTGTTNREWRMAG